MCTLTLLSSFSLLLSSSLFFSPLSLFPSLENQNKQTNKQRHSLAILPCTGSSDWLIRNPGLYTVYHHPKLLDSELRVIIFLLSLKTRELTLRDVVFCLFDFLSISWLRLIILLSTNCVNILTLSTLLPSNLFSLPLPHPLERN